MSDRWIDRNGISELCEVSIYEARKIFSEYQGKLKDTGIAQINKKKLPRKWFIEEFMKDYGVPL